MYIVQILLNSVRPTPFQQQLQKKYKSQVQATYNTLSLVSLLCNNTDLAHESNVTKAPDLPKLDIFSDNVRPTPNIKYSTSYEHPSIF